MRIKILFLLLAVCFLMTAAHGQSVVITSKKVTYKRPKPYYNFKKTFTVNYPKIKAATRALSRRIEAAISYESNFDMSIKEEVNDVQWLEDAGYDVSYNANGLLSIALSIWGTGAYPWGSTKHLVVDLKTGTKAKPANIFTNHADLLAMVIKAKDKEVANAIVSLKNDPENKDADIEDMFKSSEEYSKITLDQFSITKKGVTFYYDYGFPHVAEAWQPPGEFMFTWKQLRPYIKPGGLLARIAR